MNGKLIKTEVNYLLEDKKGVVIASTSLKGDGLSLSLKNCQAIERGYDLNELGMDYASTIYDGRTELTRFNGAKVDFIKGFQKALELMGDKKFSEEDMRIAFFHVQNEPTFDEFIQSLQQMEWDVEIEMEEYEPLYGEGSTLRPKLDQDWCLILKRI